MAARKVGLFALPKELNDSVYTTERYVLLLDPTGQAAQFLKYRARYLNVMKRGDFEKESLRKALVQALHNGAWLCLDFDRLDCDMVSLFDAANFPEQVLSPHEIFLEDTYQPLIRPTDQFAAKVTYEHQAALAEGAFQDRTKAYAPERCADVDSKFEPKDGFRLVVASNKLEAPEELAAKMTVLLVEATAQQVADNAGTWAGGERPKASKSKEQVKIDNDLLEAAFDGELDEVRRLLDNDADPNAKDGRGNTAVSEAAVQGHLETVRCLLDWRKPIGSDPNAFGSDGRTALHRAAFQGHHETVQLLLENGSDPRTKDRHGDRPFDMASNEETRAVLADENWDVARTDVLKEERKKAVDAEDEKHVRNAEEKVQLERRRKMLKLAEYAEQGDKDMLEAELMNLESGQIGSYRDDRGNTVLHISAGAGRLECTVMLITDFGMNPNLRDTKGWTPIAAASFHGRKRVCQELVALKANPSIANAYRKDAYDVAQDEEVREALKIAVDGPPRASLAVAAGDSRSAAPEAKAKAKAKGKAKAKAGGAGGGDAKARAPSAGAKAKGKAKAKGGR